MHRIAPGESHDVEARDLAPSYLSYGNRRELCSVARQQPLGWDAPADGMAAYPEPHLVLARRLNDEGLLYPIEAILESADFNSQVEQETVRIAYEQAGAWVTYLVQTYGIDKMKQIVAGVPYGASRDLIRSRFEAIYGVSLTEAEAAWLEWLGT
jgi:hypothetical protein